MEGNQRNVWTSGTENGRSIADHAACHSRTQPILSFGRLEGDRAVIVAQVDTPLSVGFYVKAGGVGDLMRSTTGHAILAHQTTDVSSRAVQLWSQHNGARPPRDLDLHLSKIKERGYEERESYEVEGVINISFPVFDDRGHAIAGLSVPFLQRIGDQTTPVTVRRVLKEASSLLSEAMGGPLVSWHTPQ